MEFNVHYKGIFIGLFIGAAAITATAVQLDESKRVTQLSESWAIQERKPSPVIGNLGGVPVSIPAPYAHFVEYDGDPHFMEKRKGPPPERTDQSSIRSFGFEIRYPDMEPVTEKNEAEKRKESIYRTMWMRVGVNSGSYYGFNTENAMERFVKNQLSPESRILHYEKLKNKTYDLIGYTPTNADISKREIGKGADTNDKNLYYHQQKNGEIDAYIECGNMKHSADRCEHDFIIPEIHAHVTVGYRRELLPYWLEIQRSVTRVVTSFRIKK